MNVVVTGAAGFIGSHLAERLLADGHGVTGVDCFLDASYDAQTKRDTWAGLVGHPRFTPFEADLRTDDLRDVCDGVDGIVNEAAMPGLLKSWTDLDVYLTCNVLGLSNLIRAAQECDVSRLIHISTSSVYGRYAVGDETLPLAPCSPYGVSKLAAEHLLRAYDPSGSLPYVVLRYFSIYGPRQRPDMAYHRFCEAMLTNRPITVYGGGTQIRSNTYVDDAVDATVAALESGGVGAVYNIAGSESTTVLGAIDILADALGIEPRIEDAPPRPGDQMETRGDFARATAELDYVPKVGIEEGLRLQAGWHRSRRRPGAPSASGTT